VRKGRPGPPPPPPLTVERVRDLAASFQRAACHAVMLKMGRALEALADSGIECRSILAGGGVTANSRLRKELTSLAAERNLQLRLPRMEYCLDNAAMIAALGGRRLMAGLCDDLTLRAHPSSEIPAYTVL
jgi:N6-L-threonylcarbamoyladenine synthase